ncbi:hypothetical protein DFS34DRAFT_697751 [Phlyctochytrium arcticum]|nr:hypothetical protein DFS34DRAFT_697751 [Phlyctochytrium arcticum]
MLTCRSQLRLLQKKHQSPLLHYTRLSSSSIPRARIISATPVPLYLHPNPRVFGLFYFLGIGHVLFWGLVGGSVWGHMEGLVKGVKESSEAGQSIEKTKETDVKKLEDIPEWMDTPAKRIAISCGIGSLGLLFAWGVHRVASRGVKKIVPDSPTSVVITTGRMFRPTVRVPISSVQTLEPIIPAKLPNEGSEAKTNWVMSQLKALRQEPAIQMRMEGRGTYNLERQGRVPDPQKFDRLFFHKSGPPPS